MSNSGGIFQALSILSSKYSRTLFIYYTITVFDGITVIPAHTLQVHYVFQILYLQTAIFIFFFHFLNFRMDSSQDLFSLFSLRNLIPSPPFARKITETGPCPLDSTHFKLRNNSVIHLKDFLGSKVLFFHPAYTT